MRPVSKKQAIKIAQYKKARNTYLMTHPDCERCGAIATEIHHKRGRIGELLTNLLYFMAVCRNCHQWIEEHPAMAKEHGYSEDRRS